MMILALSYLLLCGVSLSLFFYKTHFSKIENPPNYQDFIGVIPIQNELKNKTQVVNAIKVFKKIGVPLLLIDNASTDDLFNQIPSSDFIYHKSSSQGKYPAIQDALGAIKNPKIILIDADIHFDEKQLIQMIYGSHHSDWTWTSILHTRPQKLWHFFVTQEQNLLQAASVITFNIKKPIISNSAFSVVDKAVYQKTIPQDLQSGGDVLLTAQVPVKKQKYIQTLPPVTTNFPNTFFHLVRQRKRWMTNQDHINNKFLASLFYVFWLLLLLGAPLGSFLYFYTENPLHLLIIISSFLTLSGFALPKYTLSSFVSSLFYLTFGLFYQLILLILIIFGDHEKK